MFLIACISFVISWNPAPQASDSVFVDRLGSSGYFRAASVEFEALSVEITGLPRGKQQYFRLYGSEADTLAVSTALTASEFILPGWSGDGEQLFKIRASSTAVFVFCSDASLWTTALIESPGFYGVSIISVFDLNSDGVISLSDMAAVDAADMEKFALVYGQRARFFFSFRREL